MSEVLCYDSVLITLFGILFRYLCKYNYIMYIAACSVERLERDPSCCSANKLLLSKYLYSWLYVVCLVKIIVHIGFSIKKL